LSSFSSRCVSSDLNPEDTSRGLGLFIARKVTQAHGGMVMVDSANGKTVFTVVLPRGPHRAA
jgi:nitrogen-specific signal transduction histidine kinase